MRHFLSLAECSREEATRLLELAAELERRPRPGALAGKTLGLLFFNPSLRTLASFQAAMGRLGGHTFVVTPGAGTWSLETRPGAVMEGEAAEHIQEAVPVLGSYADALGLRVFAGLSDLAVDLADGILQSAVRLAEVPVINLESAMDHPCQALADWKTLDDLGVPHQGRFVLTWAYHPKPLPLAVPAAVAHMAALRGMEVVILRPEGFALPPAVLERAQAAAALSGGAVRETEDRAEALRGAHALYAKSWASTRHYGDPEGDRALRAELRHWRVEPSWFRGAAPECRFYHCLPVRRNVVVTDAVLDSERSAVLRQARNRLWVQMAVLLTLLGEKPCAA